MIRVTKKKTDAVRGNPVLERIWDRMNRDDMNFAGAIVADTGGGKSLTTASLCMALDPDYGAEDVCWEPLEFLEKAKDFDNYGVGDMISFEEGGVNADAREFWKQMNKALDVVFQTWREQNRGVILNLPSLDLLDKRLRKRLHYLFIVVKRTPDFVVLKVLRVKENKTSGDIKFHYPMFDQDDGTVKRVKYIRVGLPPEGFIEQFKKDEKEFKRGLIEEKYEELREDLGGGELDPGDIAQDIIEEGSFEDYVRKNGVQRYLDKDKIYRDYKDEGINKSSDTDAIKSILYEKVERDGESLHQKSNWV